MITEFATAKINLFLHVTGKREDGYHTLQSLVIFPPIKDTITVKRSKDLSLEITGPYAEQLWSASDIEENLVIRAARTIQNHMGHDKGAHIVLDKQIPVAAGIGGGSADAAATLRALLQHWKHYPDISTVRSLALSLGADVPVCLASQELIQAKASPPKKYMLA
jgi:4-diphosphocytidyl-2-C-methyl-D-erythritol kinase